MSHERYRYRKKCGYTSPDVLLSAVFARLAILLYFGSLIYQKIAQIEESLIVNFYIISHFALLRHMLLKIPRFEVRGNPHNLGNVTKFTIAG
jgi:hypothetical protein